MPEVIKPYLFQDLIYPFSLPDLGYPYDALEPYFDAQTMELHHTKHHQAYINALNGALDKHPDYQTYTLEELLINLSKMPDDIRVTVQNHGGGHKNHSLFWLYLSVSGAKEPTGSLAKAIEASFGSFDEFKTTFNTAAKKQFGSGWAWLSITVDNNLVVTGTPNQNSPMLQGLRPFLGLDVWEHAYYLKYQNRRIDYIDAWWHVIDWNAIDKLYQKALGS